MELKYEDIDYIMKLKVFELNLYGIEIDFVTGDFRLNTRLN